MDADTSALDELVERLRALDDVGVAIATEAAPAVQAVARETAAASMSPDGKAWAPTKKDGRPALPDAAAAIHCVVGGASTAVLVLTMSGPYVYHQQSKTKSAKKGLPRRVILPTEETGIPDAITKAIRDAAVKVIAKRTGGAR